VVLRDVREREALHERIAASDRLASLGTLAAGVAHEINNPLTYIMANAAMAERELGQWQGLSGSPTDKLLSALRKDLGEIEDGAERIRRIVADLSLFARPHSGATQGDLGSALNWAIRVTSTLVKSRAKLVLDIDSVPRVRGDTTRLGQVFVNLLVNAAQAIEEGEPEKNAVTISASAGGQGEVVVTITDSGSGMTAETLRRIFEPFFTTKPVGSGTGLGLSVCKGIVESLDGELTVKSERGVGSTFRVHLPAAASEPVKQVTRTEAPRLRGRVLVVDDDEIVAKSVARMLAATHEVQVVNDARKALAMLLQGSMFDVVVCDLLMPHLSGIEVYRRLLEARPEQAERVVFMSGAFTAEASEFLERVSNPRLPKPPSLAELERCVQTILRAIPGESGYHRVEPPGPATLKASGGED
jgi:nitrogen-specific signal transduction histidine kinase/ActR/RegA family two-component response regulator